jgi:hypothetical protein
MEMCTKSVQCCSDWPIRHNKVKQTSTKCRNQAHPDKIGNVRHILAKIRLCLLPIVSVCI